MAKWIYDTIAENNYCDACGRPMPQVWVTTSINGEEISLFIPVEKTAYCPNCGEEMEA